MYNGTVAEVRLRNFDPEVWRRVKALAVLEQKPVAVLTAELLAEALAKHLPLKR